MTSEGKKNTYMNAKNRAKHYGYNLKNLITFVALESTLNGEHGPNHRAKVRREVNLQRKRTKSGVILVAH